MTNVLTRAGALWQRTVTEVGAEFPDVQTAYSHVDAACMFLVSDPARFDVVGVDTAGHEVQDSPARRLHGGRAHDAHAVEDAAPNDPVNDDRSTR